MKRCPQCGREYDNTMMFCLDDGSELLYGPAKSEPGAPSVAVAGFLPSDEPATAILHSTAAPGEAPTRAQIHMTDQTALFPAGTEAEPQKNLGDSSEKHRFWHKERASIAVGPQPGKEGSFLKKMLGQWDNTKTKINRQKAKRGIGGFRWNFFV